MAFFTSAGDTASPAYNHVDNEVPVPVGCFSASYSRTETHPHWCEDLQTCNRIFVHTTMLYQLHNLHTISEEYYDTERREPKQS